MRKAKLKRKDRSLQWVVQLHNRFKKQLRQGKITLDQFWQKMAGMWTNNTEL